MRRGRTPIASNATAALRLLLVTGHDETRRQIAQLLRGHFAALALFEAGGRTEALRLARTNAVDAVIIDLAFAHSDAIALAVEVRREHAQAGVILLTRIGQEALAPADLPLDRPILVPMRELAAQLPAAVAAAARNRCGPGAGQVA